MPKAQKPKPPMPQVPPPGVPLDQTMGFADFEGRKPPWERKGKGWFLRIFGEKNHGSDESRHDTD
jgi:hypothetical protein